MTMSTRWPSRGRILAAALALAGGLVVGAHGLDQQGEGIARIEHGVVVKVPHAFREARAAGNTAALTALPVETRVDLAAAGRLLSASLAEIEQALADRSPDQSAS